MTVRAALRCTLAAAVLAAAGCGSDGAGGGSSADAGGAGAASGAGEVEAKPVGDENLGSVAQGADCRDWRGGSRAERMATVAELRGQFTPQSSSTAASPLPDERAYEILDNSCSPEWAGSLRLYKLYVRAQGFSTLTQ